MLGVYHDLPISIASADPANDRLFNTLIATIGQTTSVRFRQSSDQRAIALRGLQIPSGDDKYYEDSYNLSSLSDCCAAK